MTESDTLTHVGFVWTALTTWTVALLEMLRAHSKQLGDRTRTCAMVSCLIFPNRLLGSQARRSLNILRGYHIDTSKKRKIIYPPNVWLNIHYVAVRFFFRSVCFHTKLFVIMPHFSCFWISWVGRQTAVQTYLFRQTFLSWQTRRSDGNSLGPFNRDSEVNQVPDVDRISWMVRRIPVEVCLIPGRFKK